jgi:hypothetical protein
LRENGLCFSKVYIAMMKSNPPYMLSIHQTQSKRIVYRSGETDLENRVKIRHA